MKPASGTIDQALLRQCIALSSSHLVTDATTNTDGLDKWLTGFSRVVDVVVALHQRDELELETLSAASKACSECWSISGSYRGLEGSRGKYVNQTVFPANNLLRGSAQSCK